jgi:hypothetical protein
LSHWLSESNFGTDAKSQGDALRVIMEHIERFWHGVCKNLVTTRCLANIASPERSNIMPEAKTIKRARMAIPVLERNAEEALVQKRG